MNWKEKLAALYKEARALADKNDKDGLTAEEETRWTALTAEIEDARGKVEEIEKREAQAKEFRAGDQQYNQGTGRRVSGIVPGGQEGRAQENGQREQHADRQYAEQVRSMTERILTHEEYLESRKRGFQGNPSPIAVRSFYHKNEAVLEYREGMTPQELRALINTVGLPTGLISPQRVPGIFTPEMPELTVRSAFINGQTNTNAIEYFRELLFTNAAAFVAEATATSPTTLGASGVKPESGLTFERASNVVETLAHWVAATNAMLADFPQMQAIIEGRLIDGLKLVEDDAILTGDGNTPNIEGLLTVTGTQTADQAYFSANAVEDAGNGNEDFNRVLRARRLVRQVGRARPSFVFVNPVDMERFMSTTDANRQYMAGGPFVNGPVPRLWGLPVIETEAIDEAEFVVGDGRAAAVWDRMDATVTVGLINDQFIRNMKTILAEERLAFTVFRPAAFVIGEFSTHA